MPDRHWMEKWKWKHELDPPKLVRKADGKQADGWQHAAEIEGLERGVDSTAMLTDPKYAMVPLKEVYPEHIDLPEPIRLGERREQKEAKAYAERMQETHEEIPWAVKPEAERTSSGMLFLGWIMTVIAALLFLLSGSLVPGVILILAFFGGAAIGTHIARQ